MSGVARVELGPYLVLERIGVGGMAAVDRALERGLEGTEHVERVVAVKRLLPSFAQDEAVVRRFVRDARLGSLLSHANIAQVYAVGRVGTEYFLATEYIDGCSLGAILRRARTDAPPPAPVAIAIVRQICLALEYAHDQRDAEGKPLGIAHRDLSPKNVLVSRTGLVKVTDFGLAQSTVQRVDQRSDLVSLGTLFQELLAGHADRPPDVDAIATERWSSAADLRAALDKVCPEVATASEIAAWCGPVFEEIDANDNRSVPPIEPSSGQVLEPIEGNTTGVLLTDVTDYAEYAVAPRTTVGLEPARPGDTPLPAPSSRSSVKGMRASTMQTHAVPPPLTHAATSTRAAPFTTSRPSMSHIDGRIDGRESAVWRAVTRVDLRVVLPAVVVSVVIGVLILASGNRASSPGPARSAEPAAPPAAVKPAPLTAMVTIVVEPPGATIVVDSLAPHTGSPWKLELSAGVHRLAISAPDFDQWRTDLVVGAGEAQLVRAALSSTPKPTSSTLSLDSYPPGLEVVFDGEPLVPRTPIRMGITPGGHTIVVHDAAGEVWSTGFVAKPNHNHRFTAARPVRTPTIDAAVESAPAPSEPAPTP